MRLRLMGDVILVKMDPDSDMNASGILIKPQGALETIYRTGEVLDVGPGKWASKTEERLPVDIKVGDGVLFNRFIASNTRTAETLHMFHISENEALLRPKDVLFVYDRSEGIAFE